MKAFYCVGTHWDREWYEPFQEFRMWLVELIDELMDLMERDPEYRCFHLDGQTIVLEDYLAICPEQRERLLGHLKTGRLLVGPWYNLPDEWLVSGESLIRNLLRGRRICRELGVAPLDFAYTPDQFGHIAALPMIAKGFGLQAGICWRGTQDEHYPNQFVWVGPDGSRMVYHKLTDKGSYGPFGFMARNPIKEAGFSDKSFKENFEPYFANERERSQIPVVLLLDAVDHQRPDPAMPRLMAELRKRYPDTEFLWGSLEEYGREIAAYADTLPEQQGELREPCRDASRLYQYLIVHTISSRYDLKHRNDECQALLERWAEPCALFERMAGGSPVLSYLEKAWEYLLKNHPHDSICGCSTDQVHRDMHYRFDQSELIGDGFVRRVIARIGSASDEKDGWKNLVVHNPLPFARKGVFEIEVAFPPDYPHAFIDGLATADRCNSFYLVDDAGRRVPYQHCQVRRGAAHKRLSALGRRSNWTADVHRIAVELELPACGYTSLTVEETDDATRTFGSLMTGPLSAANGEIEFTLNTDGTGILRHEDSGRTFENLFLYEDAGDCGDGWTRGIPINDIVYRGPGHVVSTAIEENGPLRTVFRVERRFDVPAQLDRKTGWRSECRETLRVTDYVTVAKHAPCLHVHTEVENTVTDHRLRVLFPSHVASDRSFAETPFAVVERDVLVSEETAVWKERVNTEKAFTRFFGIQDGAGGLAVLAPAGHHEYAVTQTPERSLALTLFRSFHQTAGTNGEIDGQLLGTLAFDYLICPFSGAFDPVHALRLVAEAQTGIRTHNAATAPGMKSFLEFERDAAVVTALKPADDGQGGVIRLWNPTAQAVRDRLHINRVLETVHQCDLKECPLEALACDADGGIPFEVPAGGLLTLRFTW